MTDVARGERVALAALLLPWAVVCALLPWGLAAAGLLLVGCLAALLVAAGEWARARAEARGHEPEGWALAAVLTLGYSMAVQLAAPRGGGSPLQFLCTECGRLGDAEEPFCHGCGSLTP